MLAAFITRQSGFGPEFAHPPHVTPKNKVSMVCLAAQMSQEMSRKLHYYMIPSVFLPLAHTPLTASGKTDRRMISTFGDKLSLADLPQPPEMQLPRSEGRPPPVLR